MTDHEKVKEFYLTDYEGTLFPMETCRVVIDKATKEISEYISKIANPENKEHSFLPQETVYASKTKYHLRRTMKLDPVAEFYMYRMAYENRSIFKKNKNTKRENFGYRFSEGNPIPIHESYKEFAEKSEHFKKQFNHYIKFDISAFFNSIYHHDITNWFAAQKPTQYEVNLFGQFMREINAGFSIDFLPHGLYPSKMLGSHFLSYIDNSELIKCEQMIRFMDDFMIFSNSKDVLIKDFQTIQKALGQKSLNLNSDKTVLFSEEETSIHNEIDSIKKTIMEKVFIGTGSGIGEGDYINIARELSPDEIEYLINLANEDEATDREAALIIDCIHEHTSDFPKRIAHFIYRYPHLAKKIYHKCEFINGYEELSESLKDLLITADSLNEYQLFWITKIVEKFLINTPLGGQLLALLYEHKNSTNISKAKILEIPEKRYGMPEWREVHLKNGSSGWLAWASAIGMREDTKQSKNYLMSYFSKASPINTLIGNCVNNI